MKMKSFSNTASGSGLSSGLMPGYLIRAITPQPGKDGPPSMDPELKHILDQDEEKAKVKIIIKKRKYNLE
jgi:hypothetical protein